MTQHAHVLTASTNKDYYLGNGISDHTGELFIEAWCHGGQDGAGNERPDVCNRLKLTECFKNVRCSGNPPPPTQPCGERYRG